MNLNNADRRLVNIAIGLYAILELAAIVYVGVWIARGY